MKKIARLTDLELRIMKVMWEEDEPQTISNMCEILEKKLSVGSITQAIKHMIAKGAVEIGDHVLVKSVYARRFKPCFSKEDYLVAELNRMQDFIFEERGDVFALATSIIDSKKWQESDRDKAMMLIKHIEDNLSKI